MTGDGITQQPVRGSGSVRIEPAAPRFDTAPYRYDSPSPASGVLLLFTALPVAGFVVGLIVSTVADSVYFAVLSSLAMGSVVGAVGWWLVRLGKARSVTVAVVAAAFAGVITMFGLHTGEYWRSLSVWEAQVPGTRIKELSDPTSFWRFLDRQAEAGLSFGHKSRPGATVTNLGYAASYAYWVSEVVLAGFMVFALLRGGAQQPCCELCRRWKQEQSLGHLPHGQAKQILAALRAGDVLTVLRETAPPGQVGLLLTAATCPVCRANAPIDITLDWWTFNPNGRTQRRRVGRVRYPGDVLAFLDAHSQPA
jgi:hypothetical protein